MQNLTFNIFTWNSNSSVNNLITINEQFDKILIGVTIYVYFRSWWHLVTNSTLTGVAVWHTPGWHHGDSVLTLGTLVSTDQVQCYIVTVSQLYLSCIQADCVPKRNLLLKYNSDKLIRTSDVQQQTSLTTGCDSCNWTILANIRIISRIQLKYEHILLLLFMLLHSITLIEKLIDKITYFCKS